MLISTIGRGGANRCRSGLWIGLGLIFHHGVVVKCDNPKVIDFGQKGNNTEQTAFNNEVAVKSLSSFCDSENLPQKLQRSLPPNPGNPGFSQSSPRWKFA